MTNQSYFTTPDINLACVISMSYPVDTIERLSGQKASFIFVRDTGLDELVQAFWKRETRVEPIQFAEQKKLLISRIENLNG